MIYLNLNLYKFRMFYIFWMNWVRFLNQFYILIKWKSSRASEKSIFVPLYCPLLHRTSWHQNRNCCKNWIRILNAIWPSKVGLDTKHLFYFETCQWYLNDSNNRIWYTIVEWEEHALALHAHNKCQFTHEKSGHSVEAQIQNKGYTRYSVQ